MLIVLAALLTGSSPPAVFCGIENFAWTEDGKVARAGQPSLMSLACIRKNGFGSVVNLRQESPRYYIEGPIVRMLGMDYLLLPIVDDTAASPAQISDYIKFIADPQKTAPVLTHDAGGRGRMGMIDGTYLLWKGWSTADVFKRYIDFGGVINCESGGNGQIQALHEIGLALGRGAAWPTGTDQYGNRWSDCPRPNYMANWDYSMVEFPA